MSAMFIIISCFMIYLQYKSEENIINLISLLIAPYVVIIFFNNFFFYRSGFYKISDISMIVFMIAFFLFFVGGRVAMKTTKNLIPTNETTKRELGNYNIKTMKKTLIFIIIVGMINLAYAIVSGKLMAIEGYMGSGIVGHLLLLSHAIVPFLVLHWSYNPKEISCIILTVSVMVLTFSSFIKYNIIGFFIEIFLFLTIYRKSLVKKALVILVSFVFGAFVLNYAIGFYAQGVISEVPASFFSNQLWAYCSGALINSQYMYLGMLNEEIGLIYKLLIYIFALPNMFLSVIDVRLFSSEAFDFTNHYVSDFGQDSNVIDAISRLYPADGDVSQIILFGIFMIVIGFVFMRIYLKAKQKSLSVFLPVFLTYFVFLSFFGTFYMLPGPWETMVWTLLIPKMFKIRSIKYKL